MTVTDIGQHFRTRGHFATVSRAYSTTFSALRAVRVRHGRPSDVVVIGEWRYVGRGYRTPKSARLAEVFDEVDNVRRAQMVAKRRAQRGSRTASSEQVDGRGFGGVRPPRRSAWWQAAEGGAQPYVATTMHTPSRTSAATHDTEERMKRRRHFGSVRRLPSGRFQASYWREGYRFVASQTFTTKGDAQAYLSSVETDIVRGAWIDLHAATVTVREYADDWLAGRHDLAERTTELYGWLLERHVYPTFGTSELGRVSASAVRAWHACLLPSIRRPRRRRTASFEKSWEQLSPTARSRATRAR